MGTTLAGPYRGRGPPIGPAKGEGVAMGAAQGCGVPGQTDTFHAAPHRSGLFVQRLGKAADKAVEYGRGRQEKVQGAVGPRAIAKRRALYGQARRQALAAMGQPEGFRFPCFCMPGRFSIFDHQARARQGQGAMGGAGAALKTMRPSETPSLDGWGLKKLKGHCPRLSGFLPKAQVAQYQLGAEPGTARSCFWVYAWQKDEKSRKIKKYAKSRAIAQRPKTALGLLEEHYQPSAQGPKALKRKVFKRPDSTVQSSALAETANPLLGPCMDGARNRVPQEQLDLVRPYLNHRAYKRGKREESAPIGLLAGKKLGKPRCGLPLGKMRQQVNSFYTVLSRNLVRA